jgi:hypothetical protein
MATTTSPDADKVLSSVDPTVRQQIIGQGSGDRLTSGEATRLLTAYGQNPYSASNITSAVTVPVAPPDYNDPMGYLTRLNNELGVTDAQTKYNEAVQGLRLFDQGTTSQQNSLGNQAILQGVITGQQAHSLNQRNAERVTKVDAAEAQQDYLLAKGAERDQRFNIYNENRQTMQQLIVNNPGAKIKFTDTIEQAGSKLDKYAKQVKKDAYKDSLKAMAMQLGVKTKGLSTKALESKISKTNKNALKLVKQQTEVTIQGLKMDIENTKSIIAERKKGGSGSGVSSDFQTNLQKGLSEISSGETDKYLNPAEFNQWSRDALANAKSEKEVEYATKIITASSKLLNPSDVTQ